MASGVADSSPGEVPASSPGLFDFATLEDLDRAIENELLLRNAAAREGMEALLHEGRRGPSIAVALHKAKVYRGHRDALVRLRQLRRERTGGYGHPDLPAEEMRQRAIGARRRKGDR